MNIPQRPSPTEPDFRTAPERYVWELENMLPATGVEHVTIGDMHFELELQYPHERRYALAYRFQCRNPQADIDSHIYRAFIQHGDIVLDVGANIGITAAEAIACGASHVICVEPEATLAHRLGRIAYNHPQLISLIPCALGEQERSATLKISRTHNQGHTISDGIVRMFPHIFDGKTQAVIVRTIDRLLSNNRLPSVWKIDAEGSETDILQGASQTLLHSPPRVIIAELYDPFLESALRLLERYSAKRAALTRAGYQLKLLDHLGGGQLGDEFCPTSPTYVFIRE